MDDSNNGQLRFLVRNDGNLLNPFAVPHTVPAAGAGEEENEDFEAPLEDEAEQSEDSDPDDYAKFTSVKLLNHLHEY